MRGSTAGSNRLERRKRTGRPVIRLAVRQSEKDVSIKETVRKSTTSTAIHSTIQDPICVWFLEGLTGPRKRTHAGGGAEEIRAVGGCDATVSV